MKIKKKNQKKGWSNVPPKLLACIGLASDDVTKLSNPWQRGKLVLNKESVPYKKHAGKKVAHLAKLFIPS